MDRQIHETTQLLEGNNMLRVEIQGKAHCLTGLSQEGAHDNHEHADMVDRGGGGAQLACMTHKQSASSPSRQTSCPAMTDRARILVASR